MWVHDVAFFLVISFPFHFFQSMRVQTALRIASHWLRRHSWLAAAAACSQRGPENPSAHAQLSTGVL